MKHNRAMQDKALELVGPHAHVLELGSGEGTKRLVEMFRKVTTVEHDKQWLDVADGAEYLYAPLKPYHDSFFYQATYWYDDRVIRRQLPSDYDLIIVDGPEGSHGRGGFHTYLDLFRTDVPILFDDVFRLWENRLMGAVAERLNTTATLYPVTHRRWFGVVDGRRT